MVGKGEEGIGQGCRDSMGMGLLIHATNKRKE